jgi:hypothetical protein
MKDTWLTVVRVTDETEHWLEEQGLLQGYINCRSLWKKKPSGPPGVHYPKFGNHFVENEPTVINNHRWWLKSVPYIRREITLKPHVPPPPPRRHDAGDSFTHISRLSKRNDREVWNVKTDRYGDTSWPPTLGTPTANQTGTILYSCTRLKSLKDTHTSYRQRTTLSFLNYLWFNDTGSNSSIALLYINTPENIPCIKGRRMSQLHSGAAKFPVPLWDTEAFRQVLLTALYVLQRNTEGSCITYCILNALLAVHNAINIIILRR